MSNDSETPEILERVSVPALDEMLGRKIPVLDRGFVRIIDYMGSDASIVQAARISYGAGTKKISDDEHLIRYLMRKHHTSPFEMCELKIHVRVPMDVWRQWIRHRTANVNEYSTRYSEAIDARQTTSPLGWRTQAKDNKQGSDSFIPHTLILKDEGLDGQTLTDEETALHNHALDVYQRRLDAGVAREQARKDLPLSTYTEAYWKIDLHNLLHFLRLRCDEHAQAEIRAYANVLSHILKRWVPLTYVAFVDYRINSMSLTARDIAFIAAMQAGDDLLTGLDQAMEVVKSFGWTKVDEDGVRRLNMNVREVKEFYAKLEKLGMDF